MLSRALLFFLVAVIAASFAFGGLVGLPATIAKFLCIVFLSLSVISLSVKAMRSLTARPRSH